MFYELNIENLAIIEQLSLTFQPGLTVITGETGAGKSLITQAIALALGKKAAAKDWLRAGCARARVELSIALSIEANIAVQSILAPLEIEALTEEGSDERLLLLSRELTESGSRARINGTPVPISVLQAVGAIVLEAYSQHAFTRLVEPDTQRNLLDALAGENARALRETVTELFTRWQDTQRQWSTALAEIQAAKEKQDLYQFQLQDIQAADLSDPNEDEHCRNQLNVLQQVQTLIQEAQAVTFLLQGDDGEQTGLLRQLAQVQKRLGQMASIDSNLSDEEAVLTAATEQLREFQQKISAYAETLDENPQALSECLERLDTLNTLKRKYGPALADVIAKQATLETLLDSLNNDADSLEGLQQEASQLKTQLDACCQALSELRQQAAVNLSNTLVPQLQALALPHARLQATLTETTVSASGKDAVSFLFSANPGEPLKPLGAVASGGELSRLCLALKSLATPDAWLPTLLFDEVDAGISGVTAKTVAEHLYSLSKRHQVVVITHQPLVAAKADTHWHVEKTVQTDPLGVERVNVTVQVLNEKEIRLMVLSRMMSGIDEVNSVMGNISEQLLTK